ncbi:MAG: DUF998 domain-containing protein [Blastochloris sp.]|nr:DUF998 domain-containing protein [Blastochloris sp.]
MMSKMLVTASVIYIMLVIVVAHLLTPDAYDWTQNTISDLGAQTYDNAWVMRLGFIGFGILLNTGIVLKGLQARRIRIADGLLMLYGASVLLTGIFSVKPFVDGILYSETQDMLHTAFAQLAGIAFSLSIVTHILSARTTRMRGIHISVFLLVVVISMMVALTDGSLVEFPTGIAQRILWLISFTWLLTTERSSMTTV